MKPRLSIALAAAALALVTAASPVFATCVAVGQAFPPGLWSGQVANLATYDEDEISTAVTDGVGSFWLRVDDEGRVDDGSFAFDALGYAQSWLENDDSASAAKWQITGKLSGTGNAVQIDGEMVMEMEAVIDVHDEEGPDPYSGSGNDLYGFDSTIERVYVSELLPHTPGCGTIYGEMDAPVGFGDTAVHFYAVRLDGPVREMPNVEGQLVELLEDAESMVGMDPFDSELFLGWMYDLLAFDAKVVALEACNPERIRTVGPAWSLIRTVMLDSVGRFLAAAEGGAYETTHLIGAMRAFLRGGLLGWRGEECVEAQVDERAEGFFVTFEEILIERLALAWDADDRIEVQRISIAAYQFGLPRLMAAINGGAQ